MNTNRASRRVLLVVIVLLMAVLGCSLFSGTGELQRESSSLPLDGVERVAVTLRMGGGEMNVRGGAEALMEANFAYNVRGWAPLVDYSSSGEKGKLFVEQPDVRQPVLENYRYEWDLRFNPGVQYEMDISLGAGRSDLDFSQLSVTGLSLQLGAGDARLDLTGKRQDDLQGSIRGGVGRLTVLLPAEAGVRVTIRGGIGSVDTGLLTQTGEGFVNEAYGEADTNIRLDIEGGVGEIELRSAQ